ncbi:MAG: Stealth CR1 domain-containing protein [Alistipes sp.]|nr:Stealth CR1 domain-containing protein [Alistipes sp.]
MQQEIDFVIFWVDDTDPAWREAFLAARRESCPEDDASLIRVRCWHNLHYWFRSVERFAPWVRRVHLVTWGHLPSWLVEQHPKLNIVLHTDFIPQQYLPTFNSLTIGLNLHRIEGLGEQFVVFNDDMFLTRECRPEDFFRNGLPCDMARLSIVQPSSIGHIIYNDLELINAKWDKRKAMRRHWRKWMNPRYGISNLLKTMTLLPWSVFPGMSDHHMPQPYLRSHCYRCWEEWGEALDTACRHRFRHLTNVSDYLFRYDMLAAGEFSPRNMNDCCLMTIKDSTIEHIAHDITTRRWRMICINDSNDISDFDSMRDRLNSAFDELLPAKSTYEKQ